MLTGRTHKCPNCSGVGECIIKEDEENNPHHCLGCGFDWIVRAGEIEVIG